MKRAFRVTIIDYIEKTEPTLRLLQKLQIPHCTTICVTPQDFDKLYDCMASVMNPTATSGVIKTKLVTII